MTLLLKNEILPYSKTEQIFDLKKALDYANCIINTVREPLVVLYPKLTVNSVNRSFYKTFKTEISDTIGKHIYDIGNRQWDIPQLRRLLEEILSKKTGFDDFEVEHEFENIGKKIMLLNARKLTIKSKDDHMVLLAIEDITERKLLEKKVENEKHILEENQHLLDLAKQKDDFFSLTSHELKTPVTSIKAFTQVLQMKFEAEGNTNAVWMLSKMNTQVNKLTHLITDLLDTTRIEGGKLRYNKSNFDFNALVNEVVGEMQLTTLTHSIKVKLAEAVNIFGDRERIGQVITNLLSNAIKYSPGANKINLRTINNGQYIVLSIKDFGIGIASQKQDKVFKRFFRVSGNTEDTFPGLGLGLFISSEIIKRHNGTISVQSIKDKGATFTFTLPISEAAANKIS